LKSFAPTNHLVVVLLVLVVLVANKNHKHKKNNKVISDVGSLPDPEIIFAVL